MIVSGQLDVVYAGDDGHERVVVTLGPGDHFGEIGLLQDVPRTATVTATTDAEILVVGRDGFFKLLDGSTATRAGLEAIAAERLAQTRGTADRSLTSSS